MCNLKRVTCWQPPLILGGTKKFQTKIIGGWGGGGGERKKNKFGGGAELRGGPKN